MQPFVHQALFTLAADGDETGPGGAITLALCGSWQYPPPCPLAPHQTAVERSVDQNHIRLRTVFACDPDDEERVRRVIEDALAREHLTGPDGVERTWSVVSRGPGALRPDERDLAVRLAAG